MNVIDKIILFGFLPNRILFYKSVGYVGYRKASPLLLKGLKNLEYRGYDSPRIATCHAKSRIEMRKGVGRVEEIGKKLNFFFVGCGSSYHASLAGSYLFSKVVKMHVNPVLASELENYEHFLTDKTLVFAFSQSGETTDVLEAVRVAKSRGSKVIGITNVLGSSLTMEGDALLLMHSGPEICVLSTKTYTSQVVLMNLLAHALMNRYEEYGYVPIS